MIDPSAQIAQTVIICVSLAIFAATYLLAWLAYLRFCRLLVKEAIGEKKGKKSRKQRSESLKYAAEIAKAFRSPGSGAIARTLALIFHRK